MDRASSASLSPHRTPQMGGQSGETSSGGGSPASSTLSTSSVAAAAAAAAAGGASARAGGQKAAKSAKVCGVCGDRAKSYHFGGVSCDSCKAFFRRSVQNDAHRAFQCPYDSKCEITINSRKCCQFCRFRKCLDIGMEKSWVMTEEERLQLLKQRMERKGSISKPGTSAAVGASAAPAVAGPTQAEASLLDSPAGSTRGASPAVIGDVSLASTSSSQSFPPTTEASVAGDQSHLVLDASELAATRDILSKYETSFRQVPYPPELQASNDKRTLIEVITFFTTTIKRLTHFAGQLDPFQELPRSDQAALLRCGMIEMCLIRAAYAYDPERACWPDTRLPLYADSPYLRVEDLRRLVSPELHAMHMKFNHDVRRLAQLDEATYMLLLLVVMFSPERPGLIRGDLVTRTQDHYLILLRRYMSWRHSPQVAAKLYPRLLLKLPDLRQLNDAHNQSHLELTARDIREIQRQFGIILHGYSIEGTAAGATAPPPPPPPRHHGDNGNVAARTPSPRPIHPTVRTASPPTRDSGRPTESTPGTSFESTPSALYESAPRAGRRHHHPSSQSDDGHSQTQPSTSIYRPPDPVHVHRTFAVVPPPRRYQPEATRRHHEFPPSLAGSSAYHEAGPSRESPSTSGTDRLHILCQQVGPAWYDTQQATGVGDESLGTELRRPPLRHAASRVAGEWHGGTAEPERGGEKPP